MTTRKPRFSTGQSAVVLTLSLILAGALPISLAGLAQDDGGAGSRHLCPYKAIRPDGTCDPNPGETSSKSSPAAKKKSPQYTRVAKQSSTKAKCNTRVEQTQKKKAEGNCNSQASRVKDDLPESSPRVGVTIWRLRDTKWDYEGARILSHPEYQAERLGGSPVLKYGERVRLSIVSPRDGYLYLFDRELYHDGSLSASYMVFPASRLRGGDHRILKYRPLELPGVNDKPFYFDAKQIGMDPTKRLVGEILSIAITDKPIKDLTPGTAETLVPTDVMESIENLYAGRAEVFELDFGVGQAYSNVESDAASNDHSRMLTHGSDPVPQTFFLVEDKRNDGLLVTIALIYRNGEL